MSIISGLNSLASSALSYIGGAISTRAVVLTAVAATVFIAMNANRPVERVPASARAALELRSLGFAEMISARGVDQLLIPAICNDRPDDALGLLMYCEDHSIPIPNPGLALKVAVEKDQYRVVLALCASKSIRVEHLFIALMAANFNAANTNAPNAANIRQALEHLRARLILELGTAVFEARFQELANRRQVFLQPD